MAKAGPWSSVLLAHLPAHRHADATPSLESALAAMLDAAQSTWPDLRIGPEVFLAHVAEHLPAEGDLAGAFGALRASDLYLACACAAGDRVALAHFERTLLSGIPGFLAGMRPSSPFADEVAQLVREKLLVGKEGGRPKIADYSGRGPLAGWLRVTSIRTALNLQESLERHAGEGEEELALLTAGVDPELDYLRVRYRSELSEALRSAIARLSEQQATVLRFHLCDGLTFDEIGAFYSVHKSTISRWLAAAREELLAATRRRLEKRLKLTDSEYSSLVRMLESDLDVSLHRFLRER
jgi:RNA polymerase sigma-70 factor (ECF subfamily)